jgi:plastocyanin
MILTVIASAVVAAVGIPVGTAGASGGGGCGQPVTDAAGTTVRIRNYCFGPTILRAVPGDEVTFINRDSAPHTVLGANASWGSFRDMRRGDEMTYRFARAGVYPFVCTYHPGMVGAVVVGGGTPMATTGAAEPVVRVSAAAADEAVAAVNSGPAAASTPADPGGQIEPWQVTGLALAAIVAGGLLMRNRGRRQRAGV